VDRTPQGAGERQRLALFNALQDDLVALHDVVE
jgi:hypothetical protein